MGVSLQEILPALQLTESRPFNLQASPTPIESFSALYANSPLARFFLDGSPHTPDVNHNVLAAFDYVLATLTKSQSTVGSIEGSMGAGKTTLLAKIAKRFPQAQVFRHTNDTDRFATTNLTTQAEPNGHDTGIPAQTYHSATDLLELIRFNPGTIVLVDEWQFADPADLQNLIDTAYANMTLLIFGSLNTDFARRPWPNALLLKDHVDLFSVVLAARCSTPNCRQPGLFTTRLVTLPESHTRPAYTDEPVVQVGTVANAYFPTCARHHQVWQPQDAAKLWPPN
ncbi:MAG: hypothetical protein A2784_04950 [Candidatus Chisholmbacteria bacterium RIFCSPHIGHO2_01_FULL_48_12]|uniref:thymidine kinase n=1 Tax=Candidatus Chisholmbacteria bacterium RIFCSPHIGHO2_01_FULL_48_12 TaxID=1797589 RepID=A0A1G1VRH7_9BACT|nr:MAG: hypothetical protein A2784_04950 [Candidatus Chisholmbacteria bacterium RIFCSPHIGHO2_01_FULL_48_12]